MGTRGGALANFGTIMVPGHTRALAGSSVTYGHRKGAGAHAHRMGARAHIGIGRVPGHILAPEWCPGTYGHQNGARINIGTGRVHEHIWKPEWSPCTFGHWKGA